MPIPRPDPGSSTSSFAVLIWVYRGEIIGAVGTYAIGSQIEVLGEHAGWLALQAGIAVCADAVLIPEIPYDLQKLAVKLRAKIKAGRACGLVVVAEGALPREGQQSQADAVGPESLRASLSPGATGRGGSHVIEGSGRAAQAVALDLQRLTDQTTYPLVLGPLVRGGRPRPWIVSSGSATAPPRCVP